MRKTYFSYFALASCMALLSVSAFSQDNPALAPPKVLQIVREDIKPGKSAAHTANEAAWANALKNAHYDVPTLAMTSLTGEPQAWFLQAFPSWADFQKEMEKSESDPAMRHITGTYDPHEAEFVSSTRIMTGRYHREYSYQPDFNIGEYRYIAVSVVRFRPGTDIGGYFKTLQAAREKAHLDNHTVVYEINSGASGGTYISFIPMSSIARWDSPQEPTFLAALRESGWRQMVAADVMETEAGLFTFSPSMSLPTAEIAAANPGFWNVKPAATHKAAAGRKKQP